MARLIDADALEKVLHEKVRTLAEENGWHDHYVSGFDDAITYVEDSPTINAVPVVHARWEERPYFYHTGVVCNACEKRAARRHNYCPNCGAKMDGGAENV